MITANHIRCDYDDTRFIEYKSTKIAGIPLGYEYEIHTNKKPEFHKLPYGFHCEREYIHDSIFGWEIKSPVAPLFYHKYLFKKFPRLPWNLKNNGPHNSGGIHIHIQKSSQHYQDRDKIVEFLSANKQKAYLISGRCSHSFEYYSQIPECMNEVDYLDDNYDEDLIYDDPDSHYNVLNTDHDNSYEFRLFAAHPKLLLPALEMADSMFCLVREKNEITWNTWLAFIKRWPRYKNIYKRIKEVGL